MPVFDKLDGIDQYGNKIAPDNYRKEESDSEETAEEPDPEVSDETEVENEDEVSDSEEEEKSGS